ncbi:penicillin-binding transpeptidase domain-containing protein [Halobacillus shinanisalinarum]|uniref:serine-type D-Ala-D-Ala carboxypeptidase n=1 Tax=Halobacillus shinanisalinarum TaxID=2932258 RepID=A0ABY4GXZ2_9BACI|nr:penicillin-binding transpeptidase domain-containing protein [Halobacillus shinanisalinarum]UOQ92963.1 penicillin-binding transpeptidase domain-containing protein [Halobacillus shinanisalinarum]
MKRALLLLFSIVFILLAGCSEQPNPETTFKNYMKAWGDQEYEKMYQLLGEKSQEQITKKEFVERYKSIYEGIQMEKLSITYHLPDEETEYKKEDTPSFDFNVSMETLAGPVEFSKAANLTFKESDESEAWVMSWDPSMIFSGMKQGDTISAQVIKPKRGEIFDVNGKGLAINGTVLNVGLVPDWMEDDREQVKEELAELLNLSVESIDAKLNQSWVQATSFVPLVSIPKDNEELMEKIRPLNGTKFQEKSARVYPLGKAAAHLTGYVGSIQAEQLEELKDQGYTSTSRIGQTGLESILEEKLRGTAGGKVSIVDGEGNQRKVLAEQGAVDGEDVNLTINADVQQSIYNQLKDDAGSSAAIHPQTGQVKALVSTPAYDPNEFVLGMTSERYSELESDPQKPLTNRFNNTYAPGSTFKPITAAIGLETGTIDPSEEMSIPDRSFSKEGWGGYSVTRVESANIDKAVNLRDALVRSDNIYFARSTLKIGEETFLEEAKDFGFSEEIPLTYPISASQITDENGFNKEITLADTGYGQGEVEMSTLHLALTYTPLITNGKLLDPVMIKGEDASVTWHEDVVSEDTASILRKNLTEVVNNPEGSGFEPQIEELNLAGKTGTAELKKSQDAEGQENGWFIAWNTDDPRLLVSMMIEDVEGGSSDVVPKVKNVFKEQLQ